MDYTTMKLLIKVKSNDDDSYVWKHLCYVNRDIYLKFMSKTKMASDGLNNAIATWIENTLGKTFELETEEDLEEFKTLIKEHYKHQYPSLYQESCIDHQGWVRVWITENMMEVINNGKACKQK